MDYCSSQYMPQESAYKEIDKLSTQITSVAAQFGKVMGQAESLAGQVAQFDSKI